MRQSNCGAVRPTPNRWPSRGLFLILTLTAGLSLLGQPNLSGKWVLDRPKSNLGQLADSGILFGPTEMIQVVRQEGADFKVSLYQAGGAGELRAELTYLTDGSECSNKLADTPVKSTAHWEGKVLVIKSDLPGYGFQLGESWVLSPDGKTLTIERHVSASSGEGEAVQRLVLERQ